MFLNANILSRNGSRNKRFTPLSSFHDSILSAVEVIQMSAGVLLMSSCCSAALNCVPGWSPPGWSHSSLQEQCMTSEHGSILDGWCVVSSVSQLRGGEDTSISEILNDLSSDTIAHGVNTWWATGGLPRDRRGKTSTPNDGIQRPSVLLLRFYTQLPSTCGNILFLKLQYSSPKCCTFTRCTLVIF